MSDLTPSAFQHVINGLSKIKHAPHHAPELYSSAAKLLKESFGSDDLGVVLVNALKSESHESVGTFLMQLEYSDLGVLALVKSPSLSLALQAVIDSKNIKILNAVLDIILKAETLSGDLSSFDINAIESLFEKVLRLIPYEDLTISERACKLTESIISNSHTNESLLRLMFSESIRYAETEKNLYLRFINVFARIMSKSDELFESCNGCGAAEAVISLCRNRDDILVQIVAMELITEFAKTSSGLQYLFTFGVIDWLVAVTTSEEDASLLGSQALRQLGDVFATASSNFLMADDIWDAINKDLIGKYLLTVRTYLDSRSEADRLTGILCHFLPANDNYCLSSHIKCTQKCYV